MNSEEEKEAIEYEKAVGRLKRKRNSLQEEVLREFGNNLSSNTVEILKGNNLTGKEADIVGSALTGLLIRGVAERENVISSLEQWDFLYPIKVIIKLNSTEAIYRQMGD